MPSGRTFERIVRRNRTRRLIWTRDATRRLDGILRAAARETSAKLKKYAGTGGLTEAYQAALLADLNKTLEWLQTDYSGLLGISLLGAAQIAADNQADIIKAMLAEVALEKALEGLRPTLTREITAHGIGTIGVSFGHVAEAAVESTFNRVYKDGLTLSDRLWKLNNVNRRKIEDTVVQGIAQGKSARNLAKELRQYLTEEGVENARSNAMRLARTEIATAHREGHIQSATDNNGELKPHIQAIGWRLSSSHPKPDICDVWASQDIDGLGPGNYKPGSVPVDHPHGMCFQVNVLKDFPDRQFVAKEPEPAEVPESQKKAYGVQQ